LLLATDDRSDLVGLKFRSREILDFSVIEPTTPAGCSFQPAMNCIPRDSFDSSDSGFVEAFHAESRYFIKSGATVLQPIIRCPARRAECLATRLAPVATSLSAPSPVEAVTNDSSSVIFSRGRAVLVGTVETLHGWWTSEMPELMAQF
jgi:hypothetical protein